MNKQILITAIVVGVVISGIAVFATQSMEMDSLAVSASTLAKMQSDGALVVDIRDVNTYMASHIPGSSVDFLKGTTLEKRIQTIHSRIPEVASTSKIVLVGENDSATSIAKTMREAGLETYYLDGGIDSWTGDVSNKKTSTIISSDDLYSQLQNDADVYLLDVRQPEELEVSMISGSVNIPLAELFIQDISQIPTDKPVVVICGSGNRATIATYELARYGIDFQVLDGGIKAWDAYLEENQLQI